MKVIEHIRVISTDGETAHILITKPGDPSACSSCSKSSGCGGGGDKARPFDVTGLTDVVAGDELRVELDMVSPAWAGFLLFFLPMVGAFACGIGAYLVSGSEGSGFGGGLLGALAVYAGVYIFGPRGAVRARLLENS